MSDSGYMPKIRLAKPSWRMQKEEIKHTHTTTFGTGFKLLFGAIIGIFFAWLCVGMIASLIYWTGYYFIVRKYIPSAILPYIPLENPLVFVFLGLITSAALFLPFKHQLPLMNTKERIASKT